MTRIVALSGWIGSGKDTVADHLVRAHGYEKRSFAGALKDMVADKYGVPRADLDDRERKEAPIEAMPVMPRDEFAELLCGKLAHVFKSGADGPCWTPRALAILEGSVKRAVDPDYWVKRVLRDLPARLVISDLRYRSELATLAQLPGVVTIRIDRFDTTTATDASERDLDGAEFTHRVPNRGTVAELLARIDELLQ